MDLSGITEQAREALDQPVAACADGDLVAEIDECETAMRVLLAAQLQRLAEADRRGIPTEHGARSTKSWLQHRLRITGPDADARVKVARAVEDRVSLTGEPLPPELPATAAALRDGEIGVDHARVV